MTSAVRSLLIAFAACLTVVGSAVASDEGAFKTLEAQWKKLAKNHDDAASRERRKLILRTFDFLDQKASRKFLRSAYGDENRTDNRIAVVQVLAASGDPKDMDFLLGAFKKEKEDGPKTALGQGLSYTRAEFAPAVSAWAASQVAKQKDEPQRALLEGIAGLADPAAFPALLALGDRFEKTASPEASFERLIALGACGREQAADTLGPASLETDGVRRLGAALGLARSGGVDAPPVAEALPSLVAMVGDADPRVVEVAAVALGKAKHAPAVDALAKALRTAPFRVREAIRTALREITGRDAGHDADAWLKAGGTAPPPSIPVIAGMLVPTDRVALILDLSRSMAWNGRLEKAQALLGEFLHTLPEGAEFGVIAAGRTPVLLDEKPLSGTSERIDADEWIRKQLTAGGCDLREALHLILQRWPTLDTIVIASDSSPYGDSADDTPLAVIQQFRQENRTRRVQIFAVFTAPGGRYEPSEIDPDEYEDHKLLLEQLTLATGGGFTAVE